MDSNVLALFNNSNFRRLSSIVAIFGCVFCSITQELICSEPFDTSAQQLAVATVYNVFAVDTDSVTAKFDELEY